MGHRLATVFAILAALVLAGVGGYLLRGRVSGGEPARRASTISAPADGTGGAGSRAASDAGAAASGNSGRVGRAPGGDNPALRGGAVDTSAKGAAASAGIALRSGEVLDFTADVSKLTNVADLQLLVEGKSDFLGKAAWHLQARARTESPLSMVFALDDRFDSYSDAATLACLQYEMHLKERGQTEESVQRMSATGKEPRSGNAAEARVLPGTRDPLGMMQYLRTVDWTKTREVRSPVYDGHKLYEVVAAFGGSAGVVSVPAGNFQASKVNLKVFDNGAELQDAKFTLYLADNAGRTPVLLEAVLPFATAHVQLKSAHE